LNNNQPKAKEAATAAEVAIPVAQQQAVKVIFVVINSTGTSNLSTTDLMRVPLLPAGTVHGTVFCH